MYEFVDTTETAGSEALPSEALRFNGIYFEDFIPGYRTLYVKGRENPEREIEYDEIGIADGGIAKSVRYIPRTIIVGYQLISADNAAFRNAYNRLLGFLHNADAELIFRDEADKYYTGTMQAMGEIESGRNAVVGEIEFLCVDPFKRALTETVVTPTNQNMFEFVYGGAVPTSPSFSVQFGGEVEGDNNSSACGYVAFMDENSNTLQFGNLEEVDGNSIDYAKTLTNQEFTSYSGSIADRWAKNKAVLENYSTIAQNGSLTTKADETSRKDKMLSVSGYGTGSKWRGSGICRTLSVNPSNFKLTYKQRLCIGSTAQRGIFMASVSDASGKAIASVIIVKAKAGSAANVHIYVNGERQLKKEVFVSRYNPQWGYKKSGGKDPKKTTTIIKNGENWSFDVAGVEYSCSIPETADYKIAKVSFYMGKYGDYSPISTNGLYSAKLESLGEGSNTFSSGDLLEVDCELGTILLNDADTPSLGTVANDWETFRIMPGVNRIAIDRSEWADMPQIQLRFREVYL